MQHHRFLIFLSFYLAPLTALSAQASRDVVVMLPEARIVADRLVRGDGDTYGLGDWRCDFRVELDGSTLHVIGKIVFAENGNDFTLIVGEYRQRIVVGELEKCRQCQLSLEEARGTVSGPNIGARGARWYVGQGLIRRAKIVTDTFGEDVGRVGGTVELAPVWVRVDCPIAQTD
ncbi:MAG: hypothetical protein KF734_18740 [Saprospiraceae bacterium]|nr:hypothetical protein [Saprospiraceae bacterium]